jgi:tRNA 2-thiouridine synthesizing protein A
METKQHISAHWDSGHTTCGRLIIGICDELKKLSAGELLSISTADDGAPFDIPAWCRMTGHQLVGVEHPTYIIRKKS